jgi:hypothetical protein
MTAVEWVLDWMSKNQYFIGNDLLKAVEQVKQMEKEHIINAYDRGHNEYDIYRNGQNYYNETFKSE